MLIASAATFFLGATFAAPPDLRRSTVRINASVQRPDYYQPWQSAAQEASSGSGIVIEGGRILTNAHVVADQTYLEVQRADEALRSPARVEFVGHDTELAILKVEDPEFLKGTVPVPLGNLPRRGDRVAAYGFPIGGDELSVTEGIVSRIEVIDYTHNLRRRLGIQTDAALNPGSSGGPVVLNGKLVGVSFQVQENAQSIGYAIPIPLVRRFLEDVKDGRYDGVPELGIYWTPMDNPGKRRRYGLRPEQTGILIHRVTYGSMAWGALQDDDILMKIDAVPVDNDGLCALGDLRVHLSHLIAVKKTGEKVSLEILRGGKTLTVTPEARPYEDIVGGPYYDAKPSYLIAGGLVFTPVTRNLITAWKEPPTSFKVLQEFEFPGPARRQAIVISQVLPHEFNFGYHDLLGVVVESVNGRVPFDMKDLARAFEKPLGGFHEIRTDTLTQYGFKVVLEADQAAAANAEILRQLGIPSDRSADLR